MKKADEMEMTINFKSMRLSSQNIIFFGSKLYMTHKMVGNNNEE
ncbi:MAG: hypothetical protein A4E54_00907 [Pelotomaculum sp. PtaB.Bin117]|nr:hypothetical protein [Pelotomaculum terephthalicicum]OPX89608.1 MAG: hypothetical protein A4E54_00907 [Pelotomaculum sp. PtaB.Bin117]OPY61055.1 MAG: hypothetical protein A4E56_02299 [Pelotomaculum sp. PtaU1.Bin065]